MSSLSHPVPSAAGTEEDQLPAAVARLLKRDAAGLVAAVIQ